MFFGAAVEDREVEVFEVHSPVEVDQLVGLFGRLPPAPLGEDAEDDLVVVAEADVELVSSSLPRTRSERFSS